MIILNVHLNDINREEFIREKIQYQKLIGYSYLFFKWNKQYIDVLQIDKKDILLKSFKFTKLLLL